jgi:hypothetical protein
MLTPKVSLARVEQSRTRNEAGFEFGIGGEGFGHADRDYFGLRMKAGWHYQRWFAGGLFWKILTLDLDGSTGPAPGSASQKSYYAYEASLGSILGYRFGRASGAELLFLDLYGGPRLSSLGISDDFTSAGAGARAPGAIVGLRVGIQNPFATVAGIWTRPSVALNLRYSTFKANPVENSTFALLLEAF